ncbi:DUF445 family protein [Paenibacillus sp. N1-5-1-14]|uniref:DUF445 family protein n=1 Tax=Paenibacillus radicibacter TaxID=2972488 RepID=UPI0021597939|nr:DUF445 family protein [Paenibacillus radicibacter]MCR8643697.1 DUF445 family protein [Paenibacillus radicibacter]
MNPLWTNVASIAIAGFIGGVTNHLAIKMLFHPRHPIYLFGRKLPFTPGLIPKRKDEIGQSLGKVVGEYLVTSEGIQGALRSPELRMTIERKLTDGLESLSTQEKTIRELALQYLPAEEVAVWETRVAEWMRARSHDAVDLLWSSGDFANKKLGECIPNWNDDRKLLISQTIVTSLVSELKKELQTLNGERMLRRMSGQFLEKSGGFLGALAGMFMDEDKMLGKVRSAIFEQLDSPMVQESIQKFLLRKMETYEDMTVDSVLQWLSNNGGIGWVKEQMDQVIPWESWLTRLGDRKVNDLLTQERTSWLTSHIPYVVDRVLRFVESRIDRVINAIDLPAIVEKQVADFPIERIEMIILSLSGKEFRAITWLGVLLGCLIGVIQIFL